MAWAEAEAAGMTKYISVGYDGTRGASIAVDWATREAQVRGATLQIVRCYATPPAAGMGAFGYGEGLDIVRDEAQADLDTCAERVRRMHPTLSVTTRLDNGAIAPSLLSGAGPDDLVVVGASRHEGAAAVWLGSTPRALVRHPQCPIVVVRGVPSFEPTGRIVVGIVGSASSMAALDWAGDEADRHGVEFLVVHAWDHPYLPADTASTQARELVEIDAACTLDRALEVARARFGGTVTGRLVSGGSASTLLGMLNADDLLVVGTRGHGALFSAVFGSTTTAVLEHASAPVVVVPPTAAVPSA